MARPGAAKRSLPRWVGLLLLLIVEICFTSVLAYFYASSSSASSFLSILQHALSDCGTRPNTTCSASLLLSRHNKPNTYTRCMYIHL